MINGSILCFTAESAKAKLRPHHHGRAQSGTGLYSGINSSVKLVFAALFNYNIFLFISAYL